jgi:hypothetical protein
MTAAVPDDHAHGVRFGGPADLQRAWQMMAGGAPEIVGILTDIARNSPQDSVRVQAGLGLLKMGGFGQNEVTVRVVPQEFDAAASLGDGKESAAKRIEARLAKLREATYASAATTDDEVVDAEIVDGP